MLSGFCFFFGDGKRRERKTFKYGHVLFTSQSPCEEIPGGAAAHFKQQLLTIVLPISK